jgi:hypothetical protein
VEPQGEVYGFGKDFYVRLDVPPEQGDIVSVIVPCRDVTRGDVSGMEESGVVRPLGDPFRTVWECSLVLKEDGLLDKPLSESITLDNPLLEASPDTWWYFLIVRILLIMGVVCWGYVRCSHSSD